MDQVIDAAVLSDEELAKKLETPEETPKEENKELPKVEEKKDPEEKDSKADSADEGEDLDNESENKPATDKEDHNENSIPDYSKMTPEELQVEVAKLNKRVADKEGFIQRQAAEIGDLRKKTKEKREQIEKEISDIEKETSDPDFKEKFYEDPKAAIEKIQEEKEKREQRAKLLQEEELIELREQNKAVFSKTFPNFEQELVPIIAQIALEDGRDPAMVEIFRQDPYANNPAVLAILSARAKDRIYQARIKELEGKANSSKDHEESVLDKIEKATNKKPPIKSGDVHAKKKEVPSLSSEALAELSDDKLEELLKSF